MKAYSQADFEEDGRLIRRLRESAIYWRQTTERVLNTLGILLIVIAASWFIGCTADNLVQPDIKTQQQVTGRPMPFCPGIGGCRGTPSMPSN